MMQYTPLDEESEGSLILTSNDPASASPSKSSGRRRTGVPSDLKKPLTDLESGGVTDDDPFYVFREDLYRKLDLVEEALTEYLRVVHQTDTAVNSHVMKDAKKHLKRNIKNAESTLKDVQTTVDLVEKQRDKFGHIDSSELYDRRALVSTSQDRLNRSKQDMNSEQVKSKLMSDERAKVMRRAAASNHESEAERENTAFIANSAARTSLLMQQQDETLDELDEAVTRVGYLAENIHEELGFQNKMLNELDDDLVDAEEKLGLVMGKLAKLLQTKSKCQMGTILILVLMVLILFFLVIYT